MVIIDKKIIKRYKRLFKFSLSAIMSFIIDYSLFTIFSLFISYVSICNVLARIISGTFNYTVNRKYVFKSDNSLYKSLLSYALLAVSILIINTLLLSIFVYKLDINRFIAKIMVEIILFIFSFIIQKKMIFKKRK